MQRRNDSGAAAVELALVVPVLLTLVLGIIDFGFAFNAKISVTQAAREGARVVALGGTTATATSRVRDAMDDGGTATGVTTSVISSCAAGAATATVEVSATVETVLPIPDIPVTGRGVMRCEG